jgi:hypothetical protein
VPFSRWCRRIWLMYGTWRLEGRLVKCLFTVTFYTKDMTASSQDQYLLEEAHTYPNTVAYRTRRRMDFSLCYHIHTGSETHPPSYCIRTEGSFPMNTILERESYHPQSTWVEVKNVGLRRITRKVCCGQLSMGPVPLCSVCSVTNCRWDHLRHYQMAAIRGMTFNGGNWSRCYRYMWGFVYHSPWNICWI